MKRNKEKSISWSDQTIKENSKERSKGQFRVKRLYLETKSDKKSMEFRNKINLETRLLSQKHGLI